MKPSLQTDAHGIARDGIPTPWTEVPTKCSCPASATQARLSVSSWGIGEPFNKTTLAKLHPGGKDEYLRRFTAALDRAIAAGHLLPEDRAEILAVASINYDKTP